MVITFIPVSDNTDTSKIAKAKVMGKVMSSFTTPTNIYEDIDANIKEQECGCEEKGVQFCDNLNCYECPDSIQKCY